jgi:transposase InsO family protein
VRSQRDAPLTAAIVEIYQQSRRTYGSPRIHAELHARGERCSRKRVARSMGQAGLVGAHPRRRRRPLRATLGQSVDLVNRDFTPLGASQPAIESTLAGADRGSSSAHSGAPFGTADPMQLSPDARADVMSAGLVGAGLNGVRRPVDL